MELLDHVRDVIRSLKRGQRGRVGNWRSGLGLAYPHFHEDVSVSVPESSSEFQACRNPHSFPPSETITRNTKKGQKSFENH